MAWIQPAKPLFDQHILEASATTEAAKAGAVGAVFGAAGSAAFGWWIAAPSNQIVKEAARSGAFFAAATAAYYGTKITAAQMRHKDDMWNGPIGGLVAGVMLGLRAGRVQSVVAHAVFLPLVIGTGEWMIYSMPKGYIKTNPDDRHDPDYFKWPRRDPYAERWAEIQKRDQEKSA
ncbi:hypothetical protein DFJ77DRAFT_463027 [Powellomyces hirtus]|nr:hypothetical protein DFJ77DRAFT_463027 [Powellomyces hirtus]